MSAVPADVLRPRFGVAARAYAYRREDALLASARRIAAAAEERERGEPARAHELAHARTLLALRRAAIAYSYERTPRQQACVLLQALRLCEVVAPAYAAALALSLAPQLRELAETPGFRAAVASRRRAAVRELLRATYARSTLGGAALLCGAAWSDLSAQQRARLCAAYGTHTRGSALWRLRVALEPRRVRRPHGTARRVRAAARGALRPADAALAAYVATRAYAEPDELRDAYFGVPALLRADGTGALAALADAATREARA